MDWKYTFYSKKTGEIYLDIHLFFSFSWKPVQVKYLYTRWLEIEADPWPEN